MRKKQYATGAPAVKTPTKSKASTVAEPATIRPVNLRLADVEYALTGQANRLRVIGELLGDEDPAGVLKETWSGASSIVYDAINAIGDAVAAINAVRS